MHGTLRARASIVIFEPLPQCMSGDPDNGVHLWIKRFRTPKRMHSNAVLFDFVD